MRSCFLQHSIQSGNGLSYKTVNNVLLNSFVLLLWVQWSTCGVITRKHNCGSWLSEVCIDLLDEPVEELSPGHEEEVADGGQLEAEVGALQNEIAQVPRRRRAGRVHEALELGRAELAAVAKADLNQIYQ
jgi:hypothetical protein